MYTAPGVPHVTRARHMLRATASAVRLCTSTAMRRWIMIACPLVFAQRSPCTPASCLPLTPTHARAHTHTHAYAHTHTAPRPLRTRCKAPPPRVYGKLVYFNTLKNDVSC